MIVVFLLPVSFTLHDAPMILRNTLHIGLEKASWKERG